MSTDQTARMHRLMRLFLFAYTLRCKGTLALFSAIFTEGNNFYDLLFASPPFQTGVDSKRMDMLYGEQILAFSSCPLLRKRNKNKTDRVASPESVLNHLTTPFTVISHVVLVGNQNIPQLQVFSDIHDQTECTLRQLRSCVRNKSMSAGVQNKKKSFYSGY